MSELSAGVSYLSKSLRSGGRGVIQVADYNTTVYLYGSINGTDWASIETLSANQIKEVVLCPYFRFSSSSTDSSVTTGTGTTKVFISETRDR